MKTLGEGGHDEICLISGKASLYSYMIPSPPPPSKGTQLFIVPLSYSVGDDLSALPFSLKTM